MAASRVIPKVIRDLPLGQRIKWARSNHAGLSHDRLVERLGRSDRSYLIKIEKGLHVPGSELRDAIADACDVPRDLFDLDPDEEPDPMEALMGALRRVIDAQVGVRV